LSSYSPTSSATLHDSHTPASDEAENVKDHTYLVVRKKRKAPSPTERIYHVLEGPGEGRERDGRDQDELKQGQYYTMGEDGETIEVPTLYPEQ
jgi:hypothetical protein